MSSPSLSTATAPPPPAVEPAPRLPRQISFIIGNEACERFSFYGMRNILTVFLASYLLADLPEAARQASAKEVFHVFVMGVYFFPLLGGWLSDRYFGKYRTIFWLSLVYCGGHACLAMFDEVRPGFYAGLLLIAVGSGGIKPCVSAFVGDQFDQRSRKLARVVFDAFYFIINFGSFFASLLIPLVLKQWGPAWAFGIPGLLMFAATAIFWAGRGRYVVVPPATKADPDSFLRVARTALFATAPGQGRPGLLLVAVGLFLGVAAVGAFPWLGLVAAICLGIVLVLSLAGAGVLWQLPRAVGHHPDEAVEGVRAVLRLLVIFALVTPFWSLFDQKASTWILQAQGMELPGWGFFQSASQMQALNPLLVMLLIPFNNLVLYPLLGKAGITPTPLRRMTAGIALSGVAWIVVGALQLRLDAGTSTTILWQVLPYALLTLGEVLVSATGLEFAYSQAPARMKSVLMSFWSLSVTVGNLWVLLVNAGVKGQAATEAVASTGLSVPAFQMFFFAGFAFVAAAAFGLYATCYRVVDHYRPVGSA